MNTEQSKLITNIENIYNYYIQDEEAKQSNNSLELVSNKIKADVLVIANYLDCSESQAIICSLVFYISLSNRDVELKDIGVLLNCKPKEYLDLNLQVIELVKKGILKTENPKNGRLNYAIRTCS